MRDKQRAETRRRLYHAALEVFSNDGVDDCRIEDIALRAEVSRAAFYFHFPTKDDVLLELLQEAELPLVEALKALPEGAPLQDFFEIFIRSLAAFWSEGQRKKLLIDVFATQLRRIRLLAHDRRAELVRHAVAERFLRAGQDGEVSSVIPPELLADFFLLNCMAAMASWYAQPLLSLSDTLQGVVFLFMNGAKAPSLPTQGNP